MKKNFLFLGILLLLLIGAAVAFPYFFKDEIVAAVRDIANENMEATLDFSDVNISLFRDFPNVSLGLEDLKITGKKEFEGIDLIKAENFDLAMDFWSVWNGGNPLKINGLHIDKPELNIFILKNQKANYDIVPGEETTEETSSDFLINLDEYSVSDGKLYYEDRTMDFIFAMDGLNHTGSGNFTAEVYDLTTKTTAEKLTAKMEGIAYLNEVKADLDALINMDMKNMKFTLRENDLKINALQLLADGWLILNEEDMEMDFKFNAPSGKFKDFLSLIPGAYSSSFDGVKANGKFNFDATVKGTYNGEKEILPAFKIDLDVNNGDFKYPDLPVGVSGIFADMKINSPSSNLDRMTMKIPKFAMKIGSNQVEGFFNLKNPMSDPNIDMKMKGKIDLEQLAKAMPMEGVEKIAGLIDADVKMRARMSQIDRGDYENVDAGGYFNIVNLDYRTTDIPPIFIKKMSANLSPKSLTVKDLDMKAGKSDLQGNGNIDNLLAYFSDEKTMTGDFYLRSKMLDANEWLAEEETASPDDPASAEKPFDRFDFGLDGQADVILYEDYKMLNTKAKGRMTSNELDANNFSTKIGKSDLRGNGNFQNIFGYVFENQTIRGDLDLEGDFLDLNELMGEEPEAATEEEPLTEPILVPENMDMNITADFGRILYDDLDLKNFRGNLKVADEKVEMKNIRMNSLGGGMAFNGSYSSKNTEEPTFAFEYDLSSLDFKQTFNTFNSFEKLAPIGKFMSGNFSSTLKMDGSLGKDLSLKLNNLNAEGFLETLNGLISGFQPLNEVSNLLNINELKSSNIKELKTWFTVQDGTVAVKEFPAKLAGIDMRIAGKHGLEQDMDYKIKAKIPRKFLEKAGVNAAANKGLDLISKEAKKLGVNLAEGEFVNVLIQLTGNISSPQTNLRLLGTEGEAVTATTVVEAVKEEAKEQVEEKVEEVKINAEKKLDEEKEKLKKQADAEVEKIMKRAQAKADLLKKEGYDTAERIRKEGYRQADSLVKKAGNNPLKKAGAKVAADRVKKETDEKVDKLKKETDKKAADIMVAAEKQAEKIRKKYE